MTNCIFRHGCNNTSHPTCSFSHSHQEVGALTNKVQSKWRYVASRLGHKEAMELNLHPLLLAFSSHLPPAFCRWHRAAVWLRPWCYRMCYADVCLGLASPAVLAKPFPRTIWPGDLLWLYLGIDIFIVSNLKGKESQKTEIKGISNIHSCLGVWERGVALPGASLHGYTQSEEPCPYHLPTAVLQSHAQDSWGKVGTWRIWGIALPLLCCVTLNMFT